MMKSFHLHRDVGYLIRSRENLPKIYELLVF